MNVLRILFLNSHKDRRKVKDGRRKGGFRRTYVLNKHRKIE